MTDKHAADYSKDVCWGGGGGRVICGRCIYCSYNNIDKRVRLLNKKAIFCLYRNTIIQARAFESNIPIPLFDLIV